MIAFTSDFERSAMTRRRGIIPTTVALGTAAAALCTGGAAAFTPPADPGLNPLASLQDDMSQFRFTSSPAGRRRPQHVEHSCLQAKADGGEDADTGTDGMKKSPADVELSDLKLSAMEFSKAVQVAKLKAEIDSIRNGPDAPFDEEAEVGRVVGGPSPPLDPNSIEAKTDADIHEIETELYKAAQSGDFDRASDLKSKLGDMHFDDCASVLCVNSAFYRAFSEKDYDAMADLWLHDSSVCCIHPSHQPLVGAKDVLNSWKQMFVSSDTSFQHNRMEPSNARLSVKGTTAVVTCDEEVFTRRFVRGRKRQTELVNRLTATNIFRKVGGKWHLVHHHASWHADSEAAKNALSGGIGGAFGRRKKFSGQTEDGDEFMTAEDALGIPTNDGISGKGYFDNTSPNKQGEGESGGSGSFERIEGLEGLTGLPGSASGGPVKRVFMGSLSDLLNGGLNNIIQDSIGSANNSGEEGTVIQFHGSMDDIDDADDDDGSDDHDDTDNSQPMVVRHINKGDEGGRSGGTSSTGVPKDALRQNCITALRDLAAKGEISNKQKRVLLTDIITCSAKGEFSMVEVAYELLCGEGDARSKDVAEEDFADQCRVFAASLPEFPGGQKV